MYLAFNNQNQPFYSRQSYIKIRTQFEGFHHYPGASKIDPRIAFLEERHRHMFHVEVTISVEHNDRELEFFLVKWDLQDFIKGKEMNNQSCEMIADLITEYLISKYGVRYYKVVVSEDGESDGIVETKPDVGTTK